VCDVLVDAAKMCSEADPASDACAINGLRRVGVRKGVALHTPTHLEACGTVVATYTHKLTDVLDPKILHPRRPCEVQSTCGVSARGKGWASTPTPRSTSATLIDNFKSPHTNHTQTCTHTLTQRSHPQTTAVRDDVHNNNQKGGDRADIRVERRLALASLCRWHGSTPPPNSTVSQGGQKTLEFFSKNEVLFSYFEILLCEGCEVQGLVFARCPPH
jgi:hypothetical protein